MLCAPGAQLRGTDRGSRIVNGDGMTTHGSRMDSMTAHGRRMGTA